MSKKTVEERRASGLYWDRAWKLVEGCTKVSPGCDNCWSETETKMRASHTNRKISDRASMVLDYSSADMRPRFGGKITMRHDNLDLPMTIKKPTVFAIWNDLFHEDVSDAFLDEVYTVMGLASQHTFLILTKRPEKMAAYCKQQSETERGNERPLNADDSKKLYDWCCTDFPNVYHGVTVCNQQEADEKIPHLLKIPGKRFLSVEPMLGAIDFHGRWHTGSTNWLEHLDQVLLGGESGKKARPMHPDWVRLIRDQCEACEIPFMFKQWGEWCPSGYFPVPREFESCGYAWRVGKKKAGRTLDGKIHDELIWDNN